MSIVEKEEFYTLKGKNRKLFTIKEKLPVNTPSIVKSFPRELNMFRILKKNKVLIARNLCLSLLPDVSLQFKKCRKFLKFDLGEDIADHQKVVLKNIVTKFSKNDKGSSYFCQMATGTGKTRLAISVIGKVGATTLVVVPTKHISEQWIGEMTSLVPNLKVSIYNNKCDQSPEDYDVIVVVINTARNKTQEFYSSFALVIIDEVHELTSNANKEVLWMSGYCRFILGLSATPEDAKNGLLPFIEGHIGKVIHSRDIDSYNIAVKLFNVSVEICHYTGKIDYLTPVLNTGGTVCYAKTLARILEDPTRVEVIVDKIQQLYKQNCNILVFAEHRTYLDKLYNILIKKYENEEIELEAQVLKGGVKKNVIESCNSSRIILTTFSYSRRGIDYSHLNALLLASPRRNGLNQIVGRILRFKSDNKILRYIIDIHDESSVLRSQITERRRLYKSRQYKITNTFVDANE